MTAQAAQAAGSVCVSILHTGKHYPDDLSDDGVIYHYPETGRQIGRDIAEIEATKEAGRLRLPIFVVLPSTISQTRAGQRREALGQADRRLDPVGEREPRRRDQRPERPATDIGNQVADGFQLDASVT